MEGAAIRPVSAGQSGAHSVYNRRRRSKYIFTQEIAPENKSAEAPALRRQRRWMLAPWLPNSHPQRRSACSGRWFALCRTIAVRARRFLSPYAAPLGCCESAACSAFRQFPRNTVTPYRGIECQRGDSANAAANKWRRLPNRHFPFQESGCCF